MLVWQGCTVTLLIEAAGWLLATLSLFAALYLLLLAIVGVLSRHSGRLVANLDPCHRFLVFVPAHNEGTGIGPTIASLLGMKYKRDMFRVIVTADNCVDDTAAVAHASGAEVWIRDVPEVRGKGHALSWAFERARDCDFDAVVVVDADTVVDALLLSQFDAALTRDAQLPGTGAYQARYDFLPADDSPAWLQTVGIAAKAAENAFIHRARTRLGLTNLLQGNGFCLTRQTLECVPWEAHSIVEDAEYALSLALKEIKVGYIEEARVASRMARTEKDSAPQRVRWAKGMFLLIGSQIPGLLTAGGRLRRLDLIELAVMLLFTSRLTMVYLTAMGLVTLLFVPHSQAMYLGAVLAGGLVIQAIYLVLVFRAAADEPVSLMNMLLLPRYLQHLGMAQMRSLRSLRTRQWTRTIR